MKNSFFYKKQKENMDAFLFGTIGGFLTCSGYYIIGALLIVVGFIHIQK